MPNQPIVFPANFATASAMAITNPDGTIKLIGPDEALPVTGGLTDSELRAAPLAVTGNLTISGGLTDAELRAAPVPVSGTLTNGELRAAAVNVTGPLTNAELRAAALPMSAGDGGITTLGAMGDGAATSDNGAFSLTALTKRLLGKFAVGQKPMAQSLAVTLASDQTNLEPGGSAITAASMPAGGAGLTGWLSAIHAACIAPILAGSNAIGTVTVTGTVNTGTGYTDSSVALAASATFTGTGRAATAAQFDFFNASAYSNVAGTLWIDQSLDSGANYFPVTSVAVAAGATGQLAVRITGAYGSATLYRVRYVNAGAAQTILRVASSFSAN